MELTKDPIDYILEGFSPQSTHPKDDGKTPLTTYTPTYSAYLKKGVAGAWENVCTNSCTAQAENSNPADQFPNGRTGVFRKYNSGWLSDKLYFFLEHIKMDSIPPTGTGDADPYYWKFVIYPYRNPPSEHKQLIWKSVFKTFIVDNTDVITEYIDLEFVKVFTSQSDTGLLSTTQKVIADATVNKVKASVLGTELTLSGIDVY